MTDLDALDRLAKAATPGPWMVAGSDIWDTADGTYPGIPLMRADHEVRSWGRPYTHHERNANAAFIAAASPSVILALVQRLRVAEAALARRDDAVVVLRQLLRLPEAERLLPTLEKGIGIATPYSAWLRARGIVARDDAAARAALEPAP